MRSALAALLLLAAPGARAALDYARFSPPSGAYVLEYPQGWRRSLGLGAVRVAPPGAAGERAGITLERYPLDRRSPRTAEAFEAALKADAGLSKRLEEERAVEVDGRPARRLALTFTAPLKSRYGQRGARRELYVIVPVEKGYYVLKLIGAGEDFERILPEFDRAAGALKLPKSR